MSDFLTAVGAVRRAHPEWSEGQVRQVALILHEAFWSEWLHRRDRTGKFTDNPMGLGGQRLMHVGTVDSPRAYAGEDASRKAIVSKMDSMPRGSFTKTHATRNPLRIYRLRGGRWSIVEETLDDFVQERYIAHEVSREEAMKVINRQLRRGLARRRARAETNLLYDEVWSAQAAGDKGWEASAKARLDAIRHAPEVIVRARHRRPVRSAAALAAH